MVGSSVGNKAESGRHSNNHRKFLLVRKASLATFRPERHQLMCLNKVLEPWCCMIFTSVSGEFKPANEELVQTMTEASIRYNRSMKAFVTESGFLLKAVCESLSATPMSMRPAETWWCLPSTASEQLRAMFLLPRVRAIHVQRGG